MQQELNREREENEKLKELYHKVLEDKEKLLIDFKAKSDLCDKLSQEITALKNDQ